MKFTSKNPAIALVSQTGSVTGVAPGSTVIEVKDDNNKYLGQIPTTVVANDGSYIPVRGITLNKTSVNLKYAYDFSKQLKATITPSDATNKAITWTSTNPTALTCVNGYLKCQRNGYGNFTVTATSVDGPTAVCNVSITRNGTVINSVDPSVVHLPDASESIVHVSMDTTNLDGYNSGYTITGNKGNVVISSRTDNGFDYLVPQNEGSARTITVEVRGNNSGDTAKRIFIHQPYSTIASRFVSPSDGGTSYCHADGSFYHKVAGTSLGLVYFKCSPEAFNDIVSKIISSDSWLTLSGYSEYRSDIGGIVGITAAANTGSARTASLTFPGGLMYYVQQDAQSE